MPEVKFSLDDPGEMEATVSITMTLSEWRRFQKQKKKGELSVEDRTQLWIVGYMDPDIEGPWELVGVFDSEEMAVAQCLDWRFFAGPAVVNEVTPRERTTWPGCYYPKAGQVASEPVSSTEESNA